MKLEFSQQICKNTPIKFYENPSSGSRVVSCVQTDRWKDRHNEASSRFTHFVNAPKSTHCILGDLYEVNEEITM